MKVVCSVLPVALLALATPAGAQDPLAGDSVKADICAPTAIQLVPLHYDLDVAIDFETERLKATARLTVRNVSDRPATAVPLLLYRLLSAQSAEGGAGEPLAVRQEVRGLADWPQLQVTALDVTLREPLAPGGETTVALRYAGHLLGYVETGMRYVQDRIDPEFAIIRPDAFAYPVVSTPCFAAYRGAGTPEFSYRARITVPVSHAVANGGRLVAREVSDGSATFVYESVVPSWRMDFAVARYGVLESDARYGVLESDPHRGAAAGNGGSGDRVFYLPGDSAGAARVLRAMQRSRELFTRWFGPLETDPPIGGLTVIEIPDGWGSQKDRRTIIQAAAAFRDSTRLDEVYHEVSHFWNVPPTDLPSPRWNEGLASYVEERAVETLEERSVLDERVTLTIEQLREQLDTRPELGRVPLIDYGREDMTGYSYRVGMLLFGVLEELVGPEAFGEAIGGFYREYYETGGSTDDFVVYADRVTAADLSDFFEDWVYSTGWADRVRTRGSLEELAAPYRE